MRDRRKFEPVDYSLGHADRTHDFEPLVDQLLEWDDEAGREVEAPPVAGEESHA
jgi:hypothetical protein